MNEKDAAIYLLIDEQNELRFKIAIFGGNSQTSDVRFICEADAMSYLFDGKVSQNDEAVIIIPSMIGKLNEGMYNARLEVMVQDRRFIPLSLKLNFKKLFYRH